MGHIYHFISFFLVGFMCLNFSNAIQCYQCNSYTNSKCFGDENRKIDENLLVTCPEKSSDGHPYVLCRKIKQVIDFEVNDLKPESRVIRDCGWDNSSYRNRCYHRSGFGGRQEVCACETDACNASPKLEAKLISIPFMTLLLLAILKLSF